jgi:hypothetical protein
MRGLTFPAVAAGVASILAYFFVPPELKLPYTLFAAVLAIAGYESGRLATGKVRRSGIKIATICIAAVVCFVSGMLYMIGIQMGSANTLDIVLLCVWLSLFCFSFAFLAAFVGINLWKLASTTSESRD